MLQLIRWTPCPWYNALFQGAWPTKGSPAPHPSDTPHSCGRPSWWSASPGCHRDPCTQLVSFCGSWRGGSWSRIGQPLGYIRSRRSWHSLPACCCTASFGSLGLVLAAWTPLLLRPSSWGWTPGYTSYLLNGQCRTMTSHLPAYLIYLFFTLRDFSWWQDQNSCSWSNQLSFAWCMHLHQHFTDFETFKASFRKKKQCAFFIKKHFHKIGYIYVFCLCLTFV